MLVRCMISVAVLSSACTFASDSTGSDEGPVSARGQVVDFQTRAAITTGTSVAISGLSPAPSVTLEGAAFTISDILPNSAFEVLAGAPAHWPTSSQVVVSLSGIDGLEVPVVSESFITGLATAFGVTPSAARGILLLHLVDPTGKPRAGVAAASFTVAGTAGPHFLDANLIAAATATASSSSGWAVFFDVPVGLAGLSQGLNAGVTVDMAAVPIAAGTVTVATAAVSDGAPVLPSHVRFATQIVPIFKTRGCQACHSGGGPGKDLGNLTLDGSAKLIYKELVEERPNTRVRIAAPETSMVLTMPSREEPPDRHPNVTFTGPRDPDYLKLLVWIREGALEN
jgi:hypothetical protein